MLKDFKGLKWWSWALMGFGVLVLIGIIGGGGNDAKDQASTPTESVLIADTRKQPAEPVVEPPKPTAAEIAAKKALAAKNERARIERARLANAKAVRELAAKKERARKQHALDKQDFIAGAKTIPYAELQKDSGSYAGKEIKLYGKVFQIQQDGANGGFMLLSVTDMGYDIWSDNVWVNYVGRTKAVADDLVTVYGLVLGSKDYDTQIGGSTTVPEVLSAYIEGP